MKTVRCVAVLAALLLACAAGYAQTSRVELDGRRSAVAETNLGNLVADALRVQSQAQLAFVTAADLKAAVFPAGTVDQGVLTYPDDKLVVMNLTGSQVQQALERSVSLLPLPNKGFLQVSGLNVWYNPAAPAGQRVTRIMLAGNRPLDPAATYKVAMPHSLARGAAGYFRIFNGAPVTDTGKTVGAALLAYVQAQGAVSPRVEGRVRAA